MIFASLLGVSLTFSFLLLWVQTASLWIAALVIPLGILLWCLHHNNIWGHWGGYGGLALLTALALGYFIMLPPQEHRDWAADVAHNAQISVEDDTAEIKYLRRFRWLSPDQTSEAIWDQTQVNLSQIAGVDMITSSWGNPKIAHLLVSFRFHDHEPITFSFEIRRTKSEKFSALGGFFKEFELALIAADERDILHWRAVARDEDMALYPLDLTTEQAQKLFLAYANYANDLQQHPQWYNTLNANCVTTTWHLAQALGIKLPLDISLILPGYLPQYMVRLGALPREPSLELLHEHAKFSKKAHAYHQFGDHGDFSAFIRNPLPLDQHETHQ